MNFRIILYLIKFNIFDVHKFLRMIVLFNAKVSPWWKYYMHIRRRSCANVTLLCALYVHPYTTDAEVTKTCKWWCISVIRRRACESVECKIGVSNFRSIPFSRYSSVYIPKYSLRRVFKLVILNSRHELFFEMTFDIMNTNERNGISPFQSVLLPFFCRWLHGILSVL